MSPVVNLIFYQIGVKNLFKEYDDIFPKEVESGLTSLRGIVHQIDLDLGASLPIKSAYKTNTEETKEIDNKLMTR